MTSEIITSTKSELDKAAEQLAELFVQMIDEKIARSNTRSKPLPEKHNGEYNNEQKGR